MRGVSAVLILLVSISRANAALPPPPVPMDRLLAKSPTIVVGKVIPGRDTTGASGHKEVTLQVARVIRGTIPGKEIPVVLGSFPAQVFPPSKEHPAGRYLLTGWNERGRTGREPEGLDLYADQVWLLERFPDHPSLRAPKSLFGVSCFEAVQARMYAPLFDALVNKAPLSELRLTIAKGFGGLTPPFVVEALHSSTDPDAGRFIWDCVKKIEADQETTSPWDVRLAEIRETGRPTLHEGIAFRTLFSLDRDEALKWCREALKSSHPFIRHSGIAGLPHFEDVDSVPTLLKMLKETPERERRRQAFARFADPRFGPLLLSRAQEEEDQGTLIRALGHLGDARAIPALLDCLETEAFQSAQEALFRLTRLRLSPNGKLARAWWERNKDRPRWHWVKQGIEQDLLLLSGRPTTDWSDDYHPLTHLQYATCWKQDRSKDQAAAWRAWWEKNRDLPQEQWVLDSFRAASHPLPALGSPDAAEALIGLLDVKTSQWWDKGPVFDTYLHPYWCVRLLKRLTGLTVVNADYVFFREHFYVDGKVQGPKWRKLWEARGKSVKFRPIVVPPRQEFRLDDEDRRLIAQDLEALRCEVEREGPLVERIPKKGGEKELLATFVLSVSNTTSATLTLSTKPAFEGTNRTVRWTTHLNTEDFVCLTKADWVTLQPGESLRWRTRQHVRFAEPKDPSAYQFRLNFRQRGPEGDAWRGQAHMPWLAVPPDAEVVKAE